ncbi:MAG: hypothetical protein WCG25_03110 [bacterium]
MIPFTSLAVEALRHRDLSLLCFIFHQLRVTMFLISSFKRSIQSVHGVMFINFRYLSISQIMLYLVCSKTSKLLNALSLAYCNIFSLILSNKALTLPLLYSSSNITGHFTSSSISFEIDCI